jgi:hypothetical protein
MPIMPLRTGLELTVLCDEPRRPRVFVAEGLSVQYVKGVFVAVQLGAQQAQGVLIEVAELDPHADRQLVVHAWSVRPDDARVGEDLAVAARQ